MAPFVLKFKGNKSFSPFSQLSDQESITRTWKACTKVAAYLDQGQRLENLSWRLWYLHSLMVEDDKPKSSREFKKMSRSMSERLEKDKHRNLEELEAPLFTGSDETSKVKQRAEERERSREAIFDPNATPTLKGMQYTFAVAAPHVPGPTTMNVVRSKHASEHQAGEPDTHANEGVLPQEEPANDVDHLMAGEEGEGRHPHQIRLPASPVDVEMDAFEDSIPTAITNTNTNDGARISSAHRAPQQHASLTAIRPGKAGAMHFPALFTSDFSPLALLASSPVGHHHAAKQRSESSGAHVNPSGQMDMGVGAEVSKGSSPGGRSSLAVSRPVFEFSIDELVDSPRPTADDHHHHLRLTAAKGHQLDHLRDQGRADSPDYSSSAATRTPSATRPELPRISTSFSLASRSQSSESGTASPSSTSTTLDPMPSALTSPVVSTTKLPVSAIHGTTPPIVSARGRPRSSSKHQRDEDDDHYNVSSSTHRSGRHAHSASLPASTTASSNAFFDIPPGLSSLPTSTPSSTAPSRRNSLKGSSGAGGGAGNGNGSNARVAVPSATPPAPRPPRSSTGGPPAGVTGPLGSAKTECANCGATSTPLWRRGLNDELNCNACGLFAKLHKRARPKTMKNTPLETARRAWDAQKAELLTEPENVCCYNCATTATPLWRKDDNGKTLCNACGLYLKLHGERRPLSAMKASEIKRRARMEARKALANPSSTGGSTSGSATRAAKAPSTGALSAGGGVLSGTGSQSAAPTYDFSASAFEFSSMSQDPTDRLTQQQYGSLLPGSARAHETLPQSAQQHAQDPRGILGAGGLIAALDGPPTFEQAFQDDGSKRRRVSPDADADSFTGGTSSASSVTTSSASSISEPSTFGADLFDPFNSMYPYPFSFDNSQVFQPPFAYNNNVIDESNGFPSGNGSSLAFSAFGKDSPSL